MFKTKTSAATLTLVDQETDRTYGRVRAVPAAQARHGFALGGNYVASFGCPQSAGNAHRAAAAAPMTAAGYTARFDGAGVGTPGYAGKADSVDSYTATFGPAGGSASPATGERGRYTDVNL